ncbi:MAG: DNA translocase FtsK 4TM domain-containing protein [Bacteroidetes bacterium]|nr:DNA translocase FtsK 4TM domain-containing protein [Bacteroidota bacterium]
MNKLRETPTEEERPARKPRSPKAKGAKAAGESRWARVAAFLRDERVHKVFGLFLVLASFYLLVAFTSYLFTWRMDQDLMSRPWGEIFSPDVRVENWLGKLGALVSHQFIFRWFGVAAFLFVFWAFIGGVRISLKTWLLPFGKTLRWSLMGLFWLPTLLGFFFSKGGWQVLGGGIGYAINNHLGAWLGTFGAGALILFAATAFFVYTFNPSLSWMAALFQRKPKAEAMEAEAAPEEAPVRMNRLRAEAEEQPAQETALHEEVPQAEVAEEAEEELEEQEEDEPAEEEQEEEVPAAIALDATAAAPDLSGITEEANSFSVEAAVKEEALTEAQIDAKIKEFGEYDPTLDLSSYVPPTLDLLEEHSTGEITVTKEELEENKNKIVSTLNNYNIGIDKIKATIGPTVTLYEIVPQAGVRISKIKNLEDDIALSLAALGIRIIAPIPGKGTIGIEVPNSKPQVVSMRAVVASEKFQNSGADLPIVLGKTISNETFVTDLAKMPHLLMAGATGQGKSVGLNAILVSLLYKKHPSQIKFVLVDPKKVELTLFNKIERHFLAKLPGEGEPIITDTKKVVATLNSLCIEMDERYELLKDAGVRNLKEYNAKFVGRRLNPENGHRFLPYIVLVVDEFADLIMTAGREVETPIARLAQLARAIGIHLIIATQRPSVNIITGTIKANFPARIAFRVTSKVDSRTILDAGGADQLIGRGDMLLSTGNDLIRIQCAFVDTPEVEAITEFIGNQRGYPDALILPEVPTEEGEGGADLDLGERDSMFEEAARVVVQTQQGSTSLIQRKLKLGYNRAGRIVDQLEAAGILGAFEGSKARKVLVPTEVALDELLRQEKAGV